MTYLVSSVTSVEIEVEVVREVEVDVLVASVSVVGTTSVDVYR